MNLSDEIRELFNLSTRLLRALRAAQNSENYLDRLEIATHAEKDYAETARRITATQKSKGVGHDADLS